MTEEGETVVRAVRDRYDGKKRNPYNEIECGSNYARPMASFALLPIFADFSFDLPGKRVGFAPVLPGDFRVFWSLGTGWGDFLRKGKRDEIVIRAGSLELSSVSLGGRKKLRTLSCDGAEIPFRQEGDTVFFAETTASRSLLFDFEE